MSDIVIIGGGIGGLTAAACLHARGIAASVFERARELREVGGGLALWPNATRVLRHLGVLEELTRCSHLPVVGFLRDWHGNVMLRMADLSSDSPAVFAHRADLHRVLLGAIPREWLHLNKTCTGIQSNGNEVRAAFADGTFSGWARAIIGADGIRSVLREMTFHDGLPVYRGYVAWRGVGESDRHGEMVGESWGCGQRFGFMPLGLRRAGWWATANKSAAEGAQTCGRDPAEWKAELIRRFARWHTPIHELIKSTPESALLCNAILDREPPKSPRPLGMGPITLLGDAAHPMTPNLGQGACMAIEDAAVLARALATISDAGQAFRAYERCRFARTALVVRDSRKLGTIGQWGNRLGCAVRGILLRVGPQWRMRKQIRTLWQYDAWHTPLGPAAP